MHGNAHLPGGHIGLRFHPCRGSMDLGESAGGLPPDVIVQDYSEVRESIVMEHVRIGELCKIRRAIIDKDVVIPAKTDIGYDLDLDRKRFHVTDSGLVVISKGMKLDAALNPSG